MHSKGAYYSSERSRLLDALLLATDDKNEWKVRSAAIQALGVCAQQGAYYSSAERGRLFDALLLAVGDKNDGVVRKAAIQALGACAQQSAHYPAEERSQLLTALLFAIDDKEDWVQKTAIQALRGYAQQSAHYSSKERSWLLNRLLFAGVCYQRYYVSQGAVELLDEISFTYQEWLSLDYEETYSSLQSITTNRLLLATPLQEFLTAYFVDQETRIFNGYTRRALGLQFIIKRISWEGVALCLQDDHLILYSSHSRQPIQISLPKENRETLVKELSDALAEQAKLTGLPLPNPELVTLPPRKKSRHHYQASMNHLT